MRFHVLGLAHLPCTAEVAPCAYSQKIRNLCKLLHRRGHTVYYYGVAGSSVECTENVTVVSETTWQKEFGANDWRNGQFVTAEGKGPAWDELRTNAILEVRKRLQLKDFVLPTMGWWHEPITSAITEKECIVAEPGIGYTGVYSRFKVYESYAWMHYLYGQQQKGSGQGSHYDAVIPNFYDPEEFAIDPSWQKSNYALFMARLNPDKGLRIASEACKRAGVPLFVAGQKAGHFDCDAVLKESHVKYLGVVTGRDKIKLLACARCLLSPTTYIEPFGGVNVEAQLCGTPAITTTFGAFTETVLDGLTGKRCSTLAEFSAAIKAEYDPATCINWAKSRYSIDAVTPLYERFFENLLKLWDDGWYSSTDAGT